MVGKLVLDCQLRIPFQALLQHLNESLGCSIGGRMIWWSSRVLNPIPMKKVSKGFCGLWSIVADYFFRQSIRSEQTSENVNGLLSGGASRGDDLRPLLSGHQSGQRSAALDVLRSRCAHAARVVLAMTTGAVALWLVYWPLWCSPGMT